ncbi:MAG: class I SAM-dependent methyltransferase [Micromonosporaceae bacterium]
MSASTPPRSHHPDTAPGAANGRSPGGVAAFSGQPQTASHPQTASPEYAERLRRLEGAWWKRVLGAQAPYRWNLRRQRLGRTLDVGCGIGRNLANLAPGSVGVDHNTEAVDTARARGLRAHTVREFPESSDARAGGFDSMLLAHVVEHMTQPEAWELVGRYLPFLKPGGRVLFITPQERGHASDPTHVWFCGFDEVAALATSLRLDVITRRSFPLPRWAGTLFTYNEFHVHARKPVGAAAPDNHLAG